MAISIQISFSRADRWRAGFSTCLRSGLLAAALAGANPVWAQAPEPHPPQGAVRELAARYPAGSIKSLAAADEALKSVDREREQVAVRFAQAEQACFPKFFASFCLDDAKEQRRADMAHLRSIEVEADAVKRRLRADERDKVLETQRAADEADAPRRQKEEEAARQAASKKADDRAKKQAAEEADAPRRLQQQKDAEAAHAKRLDQREQSSRRPAGPGGAAVPDKRAEAHQEKIERAKAAEEADAAKRARNVANYQEKVEAAEARQRKVAARKAERELERAQKAEKERVRAEKLAKP
ncbi:MAG: hypothetical protein JWQ23_3640 [Herminiimonas sp.]|nr:hypothetical protein [Herminiimonas sp.]